MREYQTWPLLRSPQWLSPHPFSYSPLFCIAPTTPLNPPASPPVRVGVGVCVCSCVCVCVCLCVYVCVRVYVYKHVWVWVWAYTYVCVCVCVSMYVCVYMCIHTHAYVCVGGCSHSPSRPLALTPRRVRLNREPRLCVSMYEHVCVC